MKLQFKILLIVMVISLFLFIILGYYSISSHQKLLKEKYESEAKVVAYSLDAIIVDKETLENKQDLLRNIEKQIWLNPNILKIEINFPEEGKMISSVSHDFYGAKSSVDPDNLRVFEEGEIISKIVEGEKGDVLRTITPIHLSGQIVGTYQIDSTLEEIDKFIKKELSFLAFFYMMALIGFIAFLSFVFSKTITNPLESLSEAAERIKNKNFKKKVEIHTGDELETLGNVLNEAMATLDETDEERKQIDRAKTELLSITSHELRSPMTPMRAQLQMLLEDYFGKLNPKQREAIEIVLNNTVRLDRIIIDFLELSRIEAARLKFNFVKSNLVENLALLIKEMKGFLPEKKIEIVSEIKSLPTILVDPDRVMQVFRNLIGNAIKFSSTNGKIFLRAKVAEDFILFSVEDNGVGIPFQEQKRIFEPFFQAENAFSRKQGGTGLGLAICKGIIESQRGKIWFKSEPGKGTIFYFTIPLKPIKEAFPVKILFSSQNVLEEQLSKIFVDVLGPIGKGEFETLKNEGALSKENLFKYMNTLSSKKVLSKEDEEKFKKEVFELFGGDSRKGLNLLKIKKWMEEA